ncbi:hypothetical protein D1BOALGB6SA_1969 [Olavius sp. associated proteobacterium Delta 1]|nr:hypothetical protein D1BOALGB6SA_1969 [Olavius sp. associated proteobacterium Delta 1]
MFEENLTKSLSARMAAAVKQPQVDLSRMQNTIASFSWVNVFTSVQKVYFKAIKSFESTR